jgi:hypothetical protein
MADGTEELEELKAELDAADDYQDEEASAAMSEAQSVIDDAKSTAGGGLELDTDADADTGAASTGTDADSGSRLPSFSLPSPSLPSLGELWSTPFFVLATLGAVGVGFGAGLVPMVDGLVAGGLGVLGMSFLLGLASGERHYLETVVAGAGVLGVLSFLGRLDVAVAADVSVARLAAIGAGAGLAAALVGTLVGRLVRGKILDALPGGESGPGDVSGF